MSDSQNLMGEEIPLYGELPNAKEDDLVIFVACDNIYYREHAIHLALSIQKYSPGVKLHIHVFNPDDEFDAINGILLIALRNLSWTITFDYPELPDDDEQCRIYYANARFTRFGQICHLIPSNYFILDADSIVRKPLSDLLNVAQANDITLRQRDRDDIRKKYLAGGILISATDQAMEFAGRNANTIKDVYASNDQFWTMDQVILAKVIEQMEKIEQSLKVGALSESYLDWDFDDNSPVWTGKGYRKHAEGKYREIYEELHAETDIDNIARNFWEEGGKQEGAKILLLVPRIDSSFKRTNLITPELRAKTTQPETAELRKYWPEFAEHLQGALTRQGANARLLTIDNWRVTPDLVNVLRADIVVIPHRQSFQVEGIQARCLFYMQVITQWLFSLDPKGWGAGASVYPCVTYKNGDADAPTFDQYCDHLINRNKSKFAQPDNMDVGEMRAQGLIPEEDYIFFPCQIPNDETILFFSDVDEEVLVKTLSQWANENRIHIVFKGHPIKKASMAPLEAVGVGPYVRWSDASIHDLEKNSAAVYTINSGSGFEAILNDRPVVTFGRVEYDAVTIKGDMADLDATWRSVQDLDQEAMRVEYRRYVDWYCRQFTLDMSLPDDVLKERFEQKALDIMSDLPEPAPVNAPTPSPVAQQPVKPPEQSSWKVKMDRPEAMFQCLKFLAKSETHGSYFEFGCFEGASLINAYNSAISFPAFQRRFIAFDSFEGLPPLEEKDQLSDYNVFFEGQFGFSKDDVEQNLINSGVPPGSIDYVEGFYDASLKREETITLIGDSKAALLHVDCDLYSSAKDVLEFMSGRIVDGAILMFDDWFCYRGRPDRGVARAFHEWKKTVPITFTEYFKYSWAGIALICNIDVESEFTTDSDGHV